MKVSFPDESALVESAKNDPTAYGELYERYVTRIYSYLYYRTGNQHDAEDLTARVFMRAMKQMPSYSDRGLPFSAWLYRIAHNLVANWYRDEGRRKVVPLEDHIAHGLYTDAPDYVVEANDEERKLLEVIRTLSDERQQLLILKFVDQLSNAEIGAIMNRSEGAIKSLYHRTLLVLRDELEKE